MNKGFSLQLKPVGSDCNIGCDYCYVKPFQKKQFNPMSQDVLEKAIAECVTGSDYPIITWHGGEPTLAGLKFFKRAVELSASKQARNILQTNATLIDPEFAAFLKQNNFEVSVSLDGPEHVHGIHRKCLGHNTYLDVMRGVSNLRTAGIEPSISATVTKETLPYAEETFDFLAGEGFKHLKFNAVYDAVSDCFSIPPTDWLAFLKRIFDRWVAYNDPSIVIREMDEVIFWMSGTNLPLCSDDKTCLNWVSVDPNGELYPCEYLRSKFAYGNIGQMSLADIRATEEYQRLQSVFGDYPQKCRDCEFLPLCGNGCPATRIRDGKLSQNGLYVYCEERLGLYTYIKAVFDQALA